MNHPDGRVTREPGKFPELSRPVTQAEFRRAQSLATDAGLRVDARDPHPRVLR